jgi:hypothetical protein
MLRTTMLPLCLLFACSGNEPAVPAASPQSAGGPATDKSVGQPTGKSPGETPPKTPTFLAGNAPHSGAVPGPIDPPWFRVEMFPGATMTSSGRTQRDDQGLFSSQMLLALADGTTRDACVETLRTSLASVIPALESAEGKGGRMTLTGKNDDYEVTAICGEGKGKMSAYISYRWLRAPATPPPPAVPAAPAKAPAAPAPAAP